VVLLDENGKEFNSINFSNWIQKNMNAGIKRLVFVIGGPFGFSEDVYSRANQQIALSQLTFSHQMVRLFFLEQLYRGFTILKGEKYHHS
ncbi:MAG: 23S rRNA (pseudouridine(1915)-N(3))-methyltransferase RlmH, partial [Bacteroidota bacterium]